MFRPIIGSGIRGSVPLEVWELEVRRFRPIRGSGIRGSGIIGRGITMYGIRSGVVRKFNSIQIRVFLNVADWPIIPPRN
jgi:hypothetical protein